MEASNDPTYRARLQEGVQAAENALQAGRAQQALALLVELLELALAHQQQHASPWTTAEMYLTERLADVAVLTGHLQAADDLLAAMEGYCRPVNPLAADHAQLRRAEILSGVSRSSEAWTILQTLPGFRDLAEITLSDAELFKWERTTGWQGSCNEGERVLFTRAYALLGSILLDWGHYHDALCLLARGRFHAQAAGAPDLARHSVWTFDVLRGRALLEQGELTLATPLLIQLMAAGELRPAQRLTVLELSAKLCLLTGQLGRAVEQLELARKECTRWQLPRAQAIALLNLAQVLILINRVGDAERLLGQAAATADAVGDAPLLHRCHVLADLSRARRRSSADAFEWGVSLTGLLQPPAPVTRRAPLSGVAHRMLLSPSGSYMSRFEERSLAFQWDLARNLATLKDWEELRDVYGSSTSRLVRARLNVLEAEWQIVAGNLECAEAALGRCVALFEACGCVTDSWQALRLRSAVLARLRRVAEASEATAASDVLLDQLTASLESSDRAIYLLNKSTATEDLLVGWQESIAREASLQANPGIVARVASRFRAMKKIHAMLSHGDRHRAHVAADPRALACAHAIGNWEWTALLRRLFLSPRDTLTVVFFVLPDRVLVIGSTFMHLRMTVCPVTRLELREQVKGLHESVQKTQRDLYSGRGPALHQQQDHLLERLAQLLRVNEWLASLPDCIVRLNIVADDVLHGVPFAALRVDGHYLVERFAVTMRFSSARSWPARRSAVTTGLVVGTPEMIQETDLPNAEGECGAVAAWMASVGVRAETLIGKAATSERVSSSLPGSCVVHMACHAFFDPDNPDRSGVQLYDDDGQAATLDVRALSSMTAQCALVSLSACWSADSFVLPGRTIISIPDVLCRAGVDSVLASLWPVADESSIGVMSAFYGALSHLPRDAALRQAQLACLQGQLKGLALDATLLRAPFFWAGWVLHGEAGRLGVKPVHGASICDPARQALPAP